MNDRSETAPTAQWWEDYLEIFFSPANVFKRRRDASFWLPLVVLTVLSAGLMLGLRGSFEPAFEADVDRQMAAVQAQNPEITAEQLEQGMEIQRTVGGIVILVMTPVVTLLIGLTLWVFGKFVGATETLGQAMLISTFAAFPRIIGLLAGGVQGLLMSPDSLNGMNRLSLGPARFLDPDTASAMTVALASRFDLFMIWITLLLAIGLKVIAEIKMSKAMVAAGLVWLVSALPALLGALRAGG